MEQQRHRRTRREHFDTEAEYRVFADRRNRATKKCRREKEEKLRSLGDRVPQLEAENESLRAQVRELGRAVIADSEKDRKIAALERKVEELERAMAKVEVAEGPASPDIADIYNPNDIMNEEWGNLVNVPGGDDDNVPVSSAFMSFILNDDSKA